MSRSVILAIGESSIHQLDGLYSLNDLHKAAGGEAKYQPAKFTALESTKALIAEIGNSPDSESLRITTGRTGGTYACRELVIAYAAWISPSFHLQVIRVFLAAKSPPAPPRCVQLPAEGTRFLVVFDGHGQPRVLDAERKCLVDGDNLVSLQTFLREFIPAAHLGPALDIIGQRAVRALAGKRAGLW